MNSAEVIGVSACLRNLARSGKLVGKRVERGLTLAGLFLQRESQKQVPVDTGNLKASSFTRKEWSGTATEVLVGYTAAYAIYVHEDLDKLHGFKYNAEYSQEIKRGWKTSRGEGQKAKFLEDPYRENLLTIMHIIAKEAMKKNA